MAGVEESPPWSVFQWEVVHLPYVSYLAKNQRARYLTFKAVVLSLAGVKCLCLRTKCTKPIVFKCYPLLLMPLWKKNVFNKIKQEYDLRASRHLYHTISGKACEVCGTGCWSGSTTSFTVSALDGEGHGGRGVVDCRLPKAITKRLSLTYEVISYLPSGIASTPMRSHFLCWCCNLMFCVTDVCKKVGQSH